MDILDKAERVGTRTFTTTHLSNLKKQRLKANQTDRVIKVALLNWTGGIAQGSVRFGTQGGLGAWHKLCNECIPLAEETQGILIRQFMGIKPVVEGSVEGLFDAVERTSELYTKAGAPRSPCANNGRKQP